MALVEAIQAIQLVDRMRGDLLELQLSTFGGRHKPGRTKGDMIAISNSIDRASSQIEHGRYAMIHSLYVLGNFKSETYGPQVLGGNPDFEATPS